MAVLKERYAGQMDFAKAGAAGEAEAGLSAARLLRRCHATPPRAACVRVSRWPGARHRASSRSWTAPDGRARGIKRRDGLSAAIPRRVAQPAVARAVDRPARAAAAARPRAYRPLPVPQREDPVLHRQRGQGLLPLLRLRRPWRRHRLRHAQRQPAVPRGGRAAGRRGRAASAAPARPRSARGPSAQQTLHDALEAAAAWFEAQLRGPARPRRPATISSAAACDDETIAPLPPRLRAGRPQRAEGRALARPGLRPRRCCVEAGPARPPRGRPRRPTTSSAAGSCSRSATGAAGSIAFGGRILGDGEPKYLNSPETPLFHKGRVLYGLAAGARAARGRAAR